MSDLFSSLLPREGSLWVAVVDLIIVYYLVYISLRLVRGTRTVPMAVGLVFLVMLYAFSRQLGFVTTYLLLDQFMSVVVIFTLIIFQDDIRRALVRFGRFAWFTKARETAVVEEVIHAAERLAKARSGGLIVFEREASLDEFITTPGTRLDSNVTRELLCTLFVPHMDNQLHDGAVIIRNYQIREAGAFLPLSSNPMIDKALGTRHRAAIGITEETDAVSVVISEERGTLSMCYRGEITRDMALGDLRRALLVLFSQEANRRKGKRQKIVSASAGGASEKKGDGQP